MIKKCNLYVIYLIKSVTFSLWNIISYASRLCKIQICFFCVECLQTKVQKSVANTAQIICILNRFHIPMLSRVTHSVFYVLFYMNSLVSRLFPHTINSKGKASLLLTSIFPSAASPFLSINQMPKHIYGHGEICRIDRCRP